VGMAPPPLRYAVQGFAPLRRRKGNGMRIQILQRPPFFHLQNRTCRSPAVECQPCYLPTRYRHLISDHIPVGVHRCADVCVPHQFLLHGNRRSNRIKPCAVAVSHRVSAEATDASLCACLLVPAPNLIV
jgi:hypothetical protein